MNLLIFHLKRKLPWTLKHPVLSCTKWYWRIRGFPVQSMGDMSMFKEVLGSYDSRTVNIFEWGSGSSTLYYSKYLQRLGRHFEWHAMENSVYWKRRTDELIGKSALSKEVIVHLSEFPEFWKLPTYTVDNPVPPTSYCNSIEVTEYIEMPKKLGLNFDVIFVDGRFRRRCLLSAISALAPGGVVILHDAHKIQYHPGLESYRSVKFMKTGKMPGSRQQSTIAICSMDHD